MYNEIKVSVALIVYNHEKYLRQAIESILMQKVNFTYEIIVGEDKSTDKSREILKEYKSMHPDKIKLIFQKENVGGTKNIYDIFMNSSGKYIALLEGDDYWIDEYKLQKQVDFLEQNREYIGVSHVIEARGLDGEYISQHPVASEIVGKDISIKMFLKGHYFSAVATVFRNIFLNKENDYSIYYKAHKYVGDLTLCMILLDSGPVKILPDVMSVYRSRRKAGESNYNSIRNELQQYEDHISLLNAVDNYFNYKYDFSDEYINRSINSLIFCIKSGLVNEFNVTFNKIPIKYRIKFYLLLPINIIKIAIKKLK